MDERTACLLVNLAAELDASGQQLIDGFAPQHLAFEDAPQVAGGGVKGLLHGRLTVGVGFQLEAGDLAIVDAAGDDPLEVPKVCRYIQREPGPW